MTAIMSAQKAIGVICSIWGGRQKKAIVRPRWRRREGIDDGRGGIKPSENIVHACIRGHSPLAENAVASISAAMASSYQAPATLSALS